jgi:hypothetical protein
MFRSIRTSVSLVAVAAAAGLALPQAASAHPVQEPFTLDMSFVDTIPCTGEEAPADLHFEGFLKASRGAQVLHVSVTGTHGSYSGGGQEHLTFTPSSTGVSTDVINYMMVDPATGGRFSVKMAMQAKGGEVIAVEPRLTCVTHPRG